MTQSKIISTDVMIAIVVAVNLRYHPTADTNGRSRVVGVPVYAHWNAPFLFFVAFLTELD
jgi:hypothetical protein